MAERKVSGNDIFVYMDVSGISPYTDYSLIICQTAAGVTRSTNEIDAKSKCGPDKQPGTQSNGVTFDGQMMVDPAAGRISSADLIAAWENKTTVGFKVSKAEPGIGDIISFGTGFISKLDDTYGEDAVAVFSGAIAPFGLIQTTEATS